MLTPLYVLIKTHQIVFNVKPEPKANDLNWSCDQEYFEALHDWQSSHQTADYANEEEREKIHELSIEIFGGVTEQTSAAKWKYALESGIVYTGNRIRIETIPPTVSMSKTGLQHHDPVYLAYLSEVKEDYSGYDSPIVHEAWEFIKRTGIRVSKNLEGDSLETSQVIRALNRMDERLKEEKETNDTILFAQWILNNLSNNNIKVYDGSFEWTFWSNGPYGKKLSTPELYKEFLTRK